MSNELKLLNVLLVEDNPRDSDYFKELLARFGVECVQVASSATAARHMLRRGGFNCAILDNDLPEGRFAGIELLSAPDLESVFTITLTKFVDDYVDSVLRGTRRFVAKEEVSRDPSRLKLALLDAVFHVKSHLDVYFNSEAMARCLLDVASFAHRDDPVLIVGESGTGKELVAQAIHKLSRRAGGPLVAINCACLEPGLSGPELFGVAKNAFTQVSERPGVFERAHGGTILFDEIGELPISEQGKLLRVLENRSELTRQGGGSHLVIKDGGPVDFRAIFATDRDLPSEARDGKFSQALLQRISTYIVNVPPLNERAEDIPLLAGVYLRQHREPFDRFSQKALKALMHADWTGTNVRGLWNTIARCLVIAERRADDPSEKVQEADVKKAIALASLPPVRGRPEGVFDRLRTELVPLAELEATYIGHVLKSSNGNIAAAARILGIGRNTLYEKMRRYGLASRGGADSQL